jgi:hypothetical protein
MGHSLNIPIHLLIFRLVLFISLFLGMNCILELNIPTFPSLIGISLGQILAKFCNTKKLSFGGFLFSNAIVIFALKSAIWLYAIIYQKITGSLFTYDIFLDSLSILGILFFLTSITTWYLLRIKGVAFLESISLLIAFIAVTSSHREFNLTSPKYLADLAWQFSIQPVTLFLYLGLLFTLISAIYLFLISVWHFDSFDKSKNSRSFFNFKSFISLVLFLIVINFAIQKLYNYYYQQQSTLTANGVGQESSPGLSPLGFNSALGSTNQPSALVRLDGDYNNNPFSPMLYFRENALSSLSGTELVIAPIVFDKDLHRTTPSEPFIIDSPNFLNRKKLSFSSYLLTDHNLSFAIDFPISIQPLKNPKPDRFKGAFQALSLVPTFNISEISNLRTKDPAWTEEFLNHYLETVKDTRYHQLALRITESALTEVDKAYAITKYLSENSIYTLTPNHSVAKGEDQVAPYLFGDLRGYCVHFAHATVFMLRSLGIPSRIGTGYLTDLSRAKDGHILLRMSDRHAWAEVYIDSIGWVPFDTKPTRVESHADSEIDQKLLEELMGMIGNDEIELPENDKLKEPGLEDKEDFNFKFPKIPWAFILLTILIILLVLKLYIRFSWILFKKENTRIIHLYRSIASILIDLGYSREYAETRNEYAYRLSNNFLDENLKELTSLMLKSKYSDTTKDDFNHAVDIYRNLRKGLHYSLYQSMISYFNPSSIFNFIGGKW